MQNLKLTPFLLLLLSFSLLSSCTPDTKSNKTSVTTELRAPAYPLITVDPYFSAWSFTDKLFESPVVHWTGETYSLIGALRVDGQVYRFLGKEDIPLKTLLPTAKEEPWEAHYTTNEPRIAERHDEPHLLLLRKR